MNKDLNTQSVLSMKSSGYYSLKTIGAKIAIDNVYPLMLNSLENLPNIFTNIFITCEK